VCAAPSRVPGPLARLGAALAVLALAACGGEGDRRPATGLPGGFRLIQKDRFQALYGPDGRIQRLLEDRDRDGRADALIVYRPGGRPQRGELDTDGDGRIDRWEHLRLDGTLETLALSRARTGRPDLWEHSDALGRVHQRDFDDDGDGRPDRTEYPQ
jgi:hypothetical protein